MIVNTHPKEIESKNGIKIVQDLAAQRNEPVVNIWDKTTEEWQQIIKTDEKITFVGPVFWWGLGHEMERWLQDVISYGFAYSYANGVKNKLLTGREFEIHLTHATPDAHADVLKQNMTQRLDVGIFGFCGAKINIFWHQV